MSAPRSLSLEAEEARRLLLENGIDDDEARALTLESETNLPEMIGKLLEADREDEATIAFCEVRREEIKRRKEALKIRRERRKQALTAVLERVELKGSLNCGAAGSINLSSVQPAVHVYDENAVPRDYFETKTSREVNKIRLGSALRAGEKIPGATLSNTRKTVTIRRTST